MPRISIWCMYLFELVFLLSLEKYLEMELLDYMVVLLLMFWGPCILFSTVAAPIWMESGREMRGGERRRQGGWEVRARPWRGSQVLWDEWGSVQDQSLWEAWLCCVLTRRLWPCTRFCRDGSLPGRNWVPTGVGQGHWELGQHPRPTCLFWARGEEWDCKLRRLPCHLRQQKAEAANVSRPQERVSHMISIPKQMLLCPHCLVLGAQCGPELTSFRVALRQWETVWDVTSFIGRKGKKNSRKKESSYIWFLYFPR